MTGVYCWARLEALLSRLRTAHRAMRPPGCDPPCRPAIPTSEWDLQHLPVPGASRPLRADSRGWPPIPLGFGRSSRLVPEPTPPQEARSRAKGGVSAAEGWATPARPKRARSTRLRDGCLHVQSSSALGDGLSGLRTAPSHGKERLGRGARPCALMRARQRREVRLVTVVGGREPGGGDCHTVTRSG
jgi:hypothetical protein